MEFLTIPARLPQALLRSALFVLLAVSSAPGATAPEQGAVRGEITAAAEDASVVILGERHREPASHSLFVDLVKSFLARGERVVVGLEIGADRQKALDDALRGIRENGEGVALPPIRNPSYEEMIRTLGRAGVRALAIDASAGQTGDRDATMAARVVEELGSGGYDRVVVLVGNLHALKEIPWEEAERDRAPRLAGRLARSGVKVASFVQRFDPGCGLAAAPSYHPSGVGAASDAVCGVWSCLRVDSSLASAMAPAAVDGVISWTCAD